MSRRPPIRSCLRRLLGAVLLFAANPAAAPAEPSSAATLAYDAYAHTVEHRLAAQHRTADTFVARADDPRLRQGELVLEQVNEPGLPDGSASLLPGAMLHHWRGTVFAAGAHAAGFERLLRDLPHYPQRFAPEVLEAAVLRAEGDHLQTTMRVRQHHGITVVLDTTYDLRFGRLDAGHGYSASRSTRE